MKIRSLLLLFAAFSVLPVLAFSFIMTLVFWQQQRAALENRFLDRVRAMAIAIDREHGGMIQVLRSVATSSALDEGDLTEFRRQARRILGEQRSWSSIVLTDGGGQEILDLRRSAQETLPSLGSQPFVKQMREDGRPVISDLIREPLNGEYVTYIGVPVMRGTEFQHGLFAVVPQPTWLALIDAYPVAPDATMTLLGSDVEDGYTLIRKVRALDAAKGGHTPAIALTAYSRVEDRIRSLSAGFTMHLPKPVDPAELVTVVASLA
jgi:CheY-like chemotaxis protein